MNQVNEINKYFHDHHAPGALLRAVDGSMKPQLPADTRWNSQLTYIHNHPYIVLVIAQNEDAIDTRIAKLIQNEGLYNEAKNLQKQLSPISAALDTVQSDTCTLADACEEWLDLVANEDLSPHSQQVLTRFNQVMTPYHFVAHVLYPKYPGKKLTVSQCDTVQEAILNKSPDVVPDFLIFMSESVVIPSALSWIIGKVNPKVWWLCLEHSNVVGHSLCELARKVLPMPCSSASLERIFSNFGTVQTKLRNRLVREQ